jgi:stage V sporulation protein AC
MKNKVKQGVFVNYTLHLTRKMDKKTKKELIDKHSPASTKFKNSCLAFLFGGLICVIGELLFTLFTKLGADEKNSGMYVTISLIFVAAVLTAFGIFDKIARYAGAGTLVPVTGFSNAVVSQAMDAKSEGYVLGVGAKIFTIAGPVILFGLLSGTIYGIIYYIYLVVARMN